MTELNCDEVRDSCAEFALDILPAEERSAVAAHLLRCPACRQEADDLYAVGVRLLDIVPGTEPPLGFDRRVMARVGSPPGRNRMRYRMIATLAAAAAIAIATTVGVDNGHSAKPQAKVLASADLRQSGRGVGEVYVYAGQPPWVMMNVRSSTGAGWVICELVESNGTVIRLPGGFELNHGGGSWGAPDPGGVKGLVGVRLVDQQGRVVASAQLS